ncbi:anti-sigma factor antagonist [Actinoplanes sp. CA-252034]|uniref:anti-sigma factor antagonist n=1 Tax=Actinoplanes sp. CA-252034 TaxID=3239906 RepID=UPI003D96EFCA
MTGAFAVHKRHHDDGIVRVSVSGRIDEDVSAALALLLVNAAVQDGVEELVIDLADVPLLAAAGIRSLLRAREETVRHGGAFRVVNVRPLVATTLRAAGVARLLRVAPDPEPAGPAAPTPDILPRGRRR